MGMRVFSSFNSAKFVFSFHLFLAAEGCQESALLPGGFSLSVINDICGAESRPLP